MGVLLLLLAATGSSAAGVARSDGSWRFSDEDPSTTYNFLAIADWGDDNADGGQYPTAIGLGEVAEEISAQQVFALGDNFYHNAKTSHCTNSGICPDNKDGVDGVLRFKTTFEDVYTADSLKKIPFYAIAGNHDHGGNVTAEIGYTTNAQNLRLSGPNQPPTRWTMPAHWHNVTQHFEVGGKQVELEVLLFDSCVMVGNTDVVNEDGTVTELKLSELPGPPDPAMAAEQLKWLEHMMSTSTADYLWVGAHYPVWAIGSDPPTGVEQSLRPLLNKWEAHYFNGHQHDLEHIVENNTKVNYISTGAGKFCCYDFKNLDTVPRGSIKFAMSGPHGTQWEPMPFEVLSGFTSYRIGSESMQVYFHAHNGSVLYKTPPILPRTKEPQPVPGPPGPFCSKAPGGPGCEYHPHSPPHQ